MRRPQRDGEEGREERTAAAPRPGPPVAASTLDPAVRSVLALQHSAGNRAAVAVLATKPGDDAANAAGLRFRGDVMMAEADAVMQTATAFQKRATADMGQVHTLVAEYLKTYRLAHTDISKRLGKAGTEAASKAAMLDAVTGILAGTAVGLVLPRLIDGYRKMKTVGLFSSKAVKELSLGAQAAREGTGETAELGIGAALGGDPKPFELPPELSADLVASQEWQQLAEGWRTLAEAAPGITEFGNARHELLREMHKPRSTEELRALLDGWTERDVPGQMRAAITEADDAMAEYTAVMDSAILRKNQYVISQELLIKWMVSLAPESEHDTDNVDADDLDAIDDFESVLADFNLIAGPFPSPLIADIPPPGDSTRLGVDFGAYWTSDDDQKAGYVGATNEKERLAYIGRLGVILMRNGERLVRLAHAAYAATGRPDPKPNDIEWTMQAYNTAAEPLVEGQVVMVQSLGRHWVYVDALKGAPNLPYGPVVSHPRTVRRDEAKRRREEEDKRKKEDAARPPDDGFRDPLQEAVRETEERFGPFPPWAPPAPETADEEPFCLAPDEYDGTISPDDAGLEPEAAKVCFGEAADAAQ